MGHLICAQEALVALGLDRVALVPVGEAPHRDLEHDPGADVRAGLCERLAAQDERLEALRVEVDRPGRSYTADTLALLRERSPEDELTLILGADRAASLPSWREPGRVMELARVAVTTREGLDPAAVRSAIAGLPGAESVVFFDMPRVDVSSSLVRQRVASDRPIRYLVPDTVAEAIDAQGLYADPAAVRAGGA